MRAEFRFHVGDGLHYLHAARLAAAAGVNLRLHDPDRAAQFFGALDRLIDTECRDAARHLHAEFAQDGFGLILVDIHGPSGRE